MGIALETLVRSLLCFGYLVAVCTLRCYSHRLLRIDHAEGKEGRYPQLGTIGVDVEIAARGAWLHVWVPVVAHLPYAGAVLDRSTLRQPARSTSPQLRAWNKELRNWIYSSRVFEMGRVMVRRRSEGGRAVGSVPEAQAPHVHPRAQRVFRKC